MKKYLQLFLTFIPAVVLVLILWAVSSRRFDPRGVPPTTYYYEYEAERRHCPIANQPLTVTIPPSIQFLQISNYKVIPEIWKNKNQLYQGYWNKPEFIWDIQVSELNGTHMIMTGADDWDETTSDFL